MAYTGSYSAMPAMPAVSTDPTAVIGRRIVAFIVDFLLASAVVVAVGAALAKTYTNAPTGAGIDACQILRDRGVSATWCVQSGSHVYVLSGGQYATVLFLGFLVWLGNQVLLQGATGATVGKFMLGLRCVNAQGEKCGAGRALVRSLLLIVDEFFCFIVGLVTVNVTHPHQRVGDLVAKTYVVAASDMGVPIPGVAPVAAVWAQPQTPPSAWGQPQQQPPAWGQPAQPQPPAWGQPVQQQPPAWGQPPAPQQPGQESPWGQPPAAVPPPPPPAWDAPQQPAPPTGPASWGTPSEQPAPPPPPPAPDQAAPAPPPPQPSAGESWWDKAVESDGDDAPTP